MHISRWSKRSEYPFRTALHPVGSFSSCNPTKILSYIRIIEQEWAKAHLKTCLQLMELWLFPRHRPLFLGSCLGWTHSRTPCPSPWGSTSFSGISWATAFDHSCHPSPPFPLGLVIWTTIITQLAIWIGGSKCSFLFRAKERSISHFISTDFVQTIGSNPIKNQN